MNKRRRYLAKRRRRWGRLSTLMRPYLLTGRDPAALPDRPVYWRWGEDDMPERVICKRIAL